MKLDLQIQCRLSYHVLLKSKAPSIALDTGELNGHMVEDGVPTGAWMGAEDDDLSVEHVRLMAAPDEDLGPGQLLLVARGVSIELNVAELEAAIAALKAVAGVPR